MPYIYKEKSRIKHFIETSFDYDAICGSGFSWYLSNEWNTDREGLAKCRECLNCKSIRTNGKIAGHPDNRLPPSAPQ